MTLFESAGARCPNNQGNWLWFRWPRLHRYELKHAKVWGPASWALYEVDLSCRDCDARKQHTASEPELSSIGQLEKVRELARRREQNDH